MTSRYPTLTRSENSRRKRRIKKAQRAAMGESSRSTARHLVLIQAAPFTIDFFVNVVCFILIF